MAELMRLPRSIGGIDVPRDAICEAAWRRAQRGLPQYLLAHSVRVYCWGAAIARSEDWTFDRRVLWTASLLHDKGLTTLPRNGDCFEVSGGTDARQFLVREGLPADEAERVERAIVLHMQPGVTLADGVESVLLDRATGLDVRGTEYELVDDVRDAVVREFPRGAFDRQFLAAIRHEAIARPTCQSARLLHRTGLAEWMARSPWTVGPP
jgi:cyanamide hydratase family protein with HD domain